MAHEVLAGEPEDQAAMICPNCGARDPYPPTVSDNATTTCPRCGHRFPVDDVPVPEGEAR